MTSPQYSNIEIKVGVFLAFCLALLTLMLIIYGQVAPIWSSRAEIGVAFENVMSLRSDAPVRYNGLEVGRVKWLRTLHLDNDNIERLSPLTKRDLENLPLRSESLRRQLRAADDANFESLCRNALKNRSMIELCLEVLQEDNIKCYRKDDQIRIVSTIFGDAAVEIISGSGDINTVAGNQLLIGAAGNFFSNLSKSMNEVKDILFDVNEVVGAQERRHLGRSKDRLSNINAKLDSITELAGRRIDVTAQRMDKQSDGITVTINNAVKMLEDLRPQSQQTADRVKVGLKDMQDRINAAQAESAKTWSEVAADAKTARADIKEVWDKSKPDYDQARKVGKEVYDKFSGLSRQVDGIRDTAGRLMSQNEPELTRMQESFKNGLVNLKYFGQAANENKDLMLSEKDKGEHLYSTAVCIYRDLSNVTQRIGRTGTEMDETCAMLTANPEAAPLLTKARALCLRLSSLRDKLAETQNVIENKMPEVERRK
ncbi:MAG: hypothetical protein V1899_04530 [Planctomycetota bacterium]